MAKYVVRIEAVDSFGSISGSNGGFWAMRGISLIGGAPSSGQRLVADARTRIASIQPAALEAS
jgi:hypothetical protein